MAQTPENLIHFWHSQRRRRVCVVLLLGLLSAVILGVFFGKTNRSGILARGDFPAFYGAGILAASEEPESVYSLEAQAIVQQAAWPQMKSSTGSSEVLAFSYPPFVAQFFSLFAVLAPSSAKALFNLLMILCLYLTVLILSRVRPALADIRLELFTLFLFFGPIAVGLISGQNVTFSMLLLASGYFGLSRGHRGLAGLAFGLLCFKPHFGAVVLLCLLVARDWRAAFSCASVWMACYLVAAWDYGLGWPILWLRSTESFQYQDLGVNSGQMVSLGGAIGLLNPLIVYFLSTIILFYYLYKIGTYRQKAAFLVSTLGALIVFISPHVLFYDLGLGVLSLPLLFSIRTDREVSILVACVLFSFIFLMTRLDMSISPLTALSLFLLIFSWKRHLRLSHLNFALGSVNKP